MNAGKSGSVMWIRVAIVVLFAVVIVSGMMGVITTKAAVSPQYAGISIASFTALPSPIIMGHTTYLNVSASGGDGSYTYTYTGLPSGCVTTDTASLTCVPASVGTFNPRVFVNDTAADTASDTTSLIVISTITVSAFTASPSPIMVGHTTYLNATATGGYGALEYAYRGLPAGCASASVTSLTCVPSAAGTYTPRVYANDTSSHSGTRTTSLVVSGITVVISAFAASANPTSVGLTTYLNVTATGGYGALTYAYSGLPTGCKTASTASLSCSPTGVGTFNVRVYANDTSGDSATQTLAAPLVVSAAGTLVVGAIQASSSSGVYTFSVSVSGGKTPYTYSWNFGDSGTSTAASPTHAYSKTGAYTVSVTVTDSAKNYKTVSTSISVTTVGGLDVGAITYTQPTPGTYDFSISPAVTGGNPPYTYAWTFGDGGTSASASPQYSYTHTGTYTVSVTVSDSSGNTAAPVHITLVVPSVGSTTGNGGSNNNYLWIIIVIVVVAVAAVLLILLLTRKPKPKATPEEPNPYQPTSSPYDYQQSPMADPTAGDMYQPAPDTGTPPASFP